MMKVHWFLLLPLLPTSTSTSSLLRRSNTVNSSGSGPIIPENHGEIYNGSPAGTGEFPQFALLIDSDDSEDLCGGVLISTKHVLTTASCLFWHGSFDGVRLGATVSTSDGVYYAIESETRHPSYDHTDKRNDVAILTLAVNVVGVTPLAYNRDASRTDVTGTALTIMGFGHSEDGSVPSDYLRKTTVFSQTDSFCDGFYGGSDVYVNNEHMCTFDMNSKSCWIDSGGPALDANNLIWGMFSDSSGATCADTTGVNQYADVWNYASWIDSIVPTPSPSKSPTPQPNQSQPSNNIPPFNSGPLTPAPFVSPSECLTCWQRITSFFQSTAQRLGLF